MSPLVTPALPSRHGAPEPRVLAGDVLAEAGVQARALGLARVLLVTDRGVRATGLIDEVCASLERAGVTWMVLDDVAADPDDADVQRVTASVAEATFDGVLAVGGGSVLDTAKGLALLRANGATMETWWGFGKAPRVLLPLIAVPTTAGTGSEAQSFAVIRRASDGQKMACGVVSARPRVVLLDPRATVTAAPEVTRTAGVDAIGHALEAAVCTVRTPAVTEAASQAAVELLGALADVVAHGADLRVRATMLYASHVAGRCVEAAMLGAAHACANALSARYGTPHGVAVGAMLPRVVRQNAADPSVAAVYADIALRAGLGADADGLADGLVALWTRVGAASSPAEVGVCPEDIGALAALAERQWTGTFNPVGSDWHRLFAP